MDADHDLILQVFVAETAESLAQIQEALVRLELAPDDREALEAIFRAAHTVKGNAAALGFADLVELAHVVEDLLEGLRQRTVPVTPDLISDLLAAVDALRELAPAAAAGAAGTHGLGPAYAELVSRLAARLGPDGPAPAAPVADPGVPAPGRSPGAGQRAASGAESSRTLRVGLDKLDRMLTLTGEIAIARGRIGQMLEDEGAAVITDVRDAHREADRLYVELQELVMQARMVPLGPMFRQHIRTVRDIAAQAGKRAILEIEGAEVEVDTTVMEHIRDPLTHMVRNAVDHGIEPPEARRSAGKDPCGRVTLSARHEAGNVVIALADDGAGLNRARIAERARAIGLVAEPEKLPDPELLRLIFEPGFSTASAVTELSGRGVGMDVVRRSVDTLGGTIALESGEGKGSTITIRLPLTLAIIKGFRVGVQGESYVIPLESVIECLGLAEEDGWRGDSRGVIYLRGKALPYLRLGDLFGLAGPTPARESIVVVRDGHGWAGLVVDTLHGECEAVIKPLGKLFHGLPAVLGSTVLGSGRVALILDVPGLLREALATPGGVALEAS